MAHPRPAVEKVSGEIMDAGGVVTLVLQLHARVPVIVCSVALDDIRARAALLQSWKIPVLHKPFNIADFVQCVTDALGPPVGTGVGDRRIG